MPPTWHFFFLTMERNAYENFGCICSQGWTGPGPGYHVIGSKVEYRNDVFRVFSGYQKLKSILSLVA